jgi:hypothetical protein
MFEISHFPKGYYFDVFTVICPTQVSIIICLTKMTLHKDTLFR